MTTLHPILPPDIVPQERMRFFRGMHIRRESWWPEKPLFRSVADWEHLSSINEIGRVTYEHVLADVLNLKQERARSFSLRNVVATCYAMSSVASLYCKGGVVGQFRFPALRKIVCMGGAPVLYFGSDQTVWLDPRFGGARTDHYVTDFASFEYRRDCARVDAELLLVHGTVTAEKLRRACRKPRLRQRHWPWQTVVKFAAQAGIGITIPHPKPFDQIEELVEHNQIDALLSSLA